MSDEMTEFEQNTAEAQQAMEEAGKEFESAEGWDNVAAFGGMLSGMADAMNGMVDGLGEDVEAQMAQAAGNDEHGGFGEGGFFGETMEMLGGVLGEFAEGGAEAGIALGGGVIDAFGSVIENVGEAGSAIAEGDVGGAAANIAEAVGTGAADLLSGTVRAGGEVVEGLASTAYELGEGVVEMGAGLVGDIADLF